MTPLETTDPAPGPSRGTWIALALVAAVLFVAPLATHDLADARETHLGADAMDTLRTGQWLVVWDREAPRLKKPPLSRWMTAGSLAFGGHHVFWLRLPGALCVLLTVFLVAAMARRVAGGNAALVAGALYITTTQVIVEAWVASAEQLLTLVVTAALYALWRAHEDGVSARARRTWLAVAGLAVGIGVLSKGPVAPLFVLFPLIGFTLATAARQAWRTLLHPALWVGIAVVVVPWLAALLAQYPEAPEVWRSEASQHSALSGPMRWPMAIKWFALAAPWVLLAAAGVFVPWHAAVRGGAETAPVIQRRGALFVLWWLLGNLVVFTLFVPSRAHYFTPVLPGLALLGALGWAASGAVPGDRLGRVLGHACRVGQPLLLFGAYVGLPVVLWFLAAEAPHRVALCVGTAVLSIVGVGALLRAYRSGRVGSASVLACTAPVGLAVALFGLLALPQRVRPGSFRPLADFAREAAHDSGRTIYRLTDALANTPISTRFRLSREFDFYLEPPPLPLGTLAELPARLAGGAPVLLLLTGEQLEAVQALAGVRAEPLGPRARDDGRHGLLAEVRRVP